MLKHSLEQDLAPKSEPTKLEGKNELQEYLAAGKLKGSNALITGGEYVARPLCSETTSC